MPKKKRKEIVVSPPTFGQREEGILDTTGEEALNVFKISDKIARVLSFLVIPAGALLSLLSLYGILLSTEFSFYDPIFIGALSFLGAINIFCGLILLARK